MTADTQQPEALEPCTAMISSCKRRVDGEREGSEAFTKRQRVAVPVGDIRGCCGDFQAQQDQQQGVDVALHGHRSHHHHQQQQHDLHHHHYKQCGAPRAKTPLGVLAPMYLFLAHGSQHVVQRFSAPAAAAQQQYHLQLHEQQQRGHQTVLLHQQQRQQHAHAQRVQRQQHDQECSAHDAVAVAVSAAAADACKAPREAACPCLSTAVSTNAAAAGSVLAPEPSESVVTGLESGPPSEGDVVPLPGAAYAAESRCDGGAVVSASTTGGADASGGDTQSPPQLPPDSNAAAAGTSIDEDDEWFDPLVFISRLPPVVPPRCVPGTLLPRRTRTCKQKTLVLDLDETLVHSTLDNAPGADGAHFHFPVLFNGAEHMVHVRMRPHMRQFLERAAELFELVVFTASQKVYAEKLLNILDPHRRLIRHRIYRDSCVFVEGNYLKDLSSLGRDLAHTAIVDNSPQAFGFQVDNGIPIESWYDDDQDTELLQLLPLLSQLATSPDVRPVLRAQFRMRDRVLGAAATWHSRLERGAMVAAAWQRQYCMVQQQQQQYYHHHQQQQQLQYQQQQQQHQQQRTMHDAVAKSHQMPPPGRRMADGSGVPPVSHQLPQA